eukprot:COSAG04_NODE_30682_length_261_cov_0.641975_2_plen_48_part_01
MKHSLGLYLVRCCCLEKSPKHRVAAMLSRPPQVPMLEVLHRALKITVP